MVRVLKVMVIMVALSLCMSISVQPAFAVLEDGVVLPSGPVDPVDDPEVMDDSGDPGGPVDGDPDTVGGGYGASAGQAALDDLLGGLLHLDDGMTVEEYIYLMMVKFMVIP